MCMMCKLLGHWVPGCTDTVAGSQTASDQPVWESYYTYTTAEAAGPVDARGVNLVGVGDPDDPHNPDFMAAEQTLLNTSSESADADSGSTSRTTTSQFNSHSNEDSESSTFANGSTIRSTTSQANSGASGDSGPTHSDGTTTVVTTTSGADPSGSGHDTTSIDTGTPVLLGAGSGGSGGQGAGPSISLNTTQAGTQITRDGYHWNSSLGQPLTITIGFRTVAPGYTVGGEDVAGTFTPFTAAEKAAALAAIGYWASIANITVVNLGDSDSAAIELGNYRGVNDGFEAFTFMPFPPGDMSGTSSQGDVFINTYYAPTTIAGDAPLGYVFTTLIHELGHALGLEHPSNYNAGSGGLTYANNASYVQDDRQYTVMSYFSETSTGANYLGNYPETPMLDDVAAIQHLYGANTNTATGDTTYGFNSNAGSVYSITSPSQVVVFNVWDAGGIDTFDFSGYSQNQTINLNAESFSSVGGLTGNVSISLGVTIENAIGGLGNDTIIGNGADNTLTGGPGNDAIDGGAGIDTAVFHGLRSAYNVTLLGNGSIQISGPDGTDVLTNVEFMKFDDQTVSAGAVNNHAPVVSAATTSFRPNQTVAASTIFSVADGDNDTITQYKLTDATSGGAYLVLNGVVQAYNTTVTVTAAQLSTLQIVTSSTAQGANAFTVQAFDGTDWSSATTVNVATTEAASVVAVTGSYQLTTGQLFNVSAGNLPISVTDADGDPLVTYRFTDVGAGANSASLVFNGTPVAQGGTVDVAVAQLSSLKVQAGPTGGVETLQVQVYDGYTWSSAQNISVLTDAPPVVSAATTSFRPNLSVATSSIFSASDPDGDTITQYKVTDTTVGGAHLTLNGVTQADNTPITVTAAQLAQLQIATPATAQGANTFTVQAFDGVAWSSATTINVATTEVASVVTAAGPLLLSPTTWFNFNVSNLPFSVTDADGDPVVTYRFIDVGAGANTPFFAIGFTNYAQGATVDVSAAQINDFWIKGGTGSGSATFQVQVYDGYLWSAAQTITAITDTAPVVSASTTGIGLGLLAPLSSFFNTTDADGDTITQYKITDITAGGASLLLNGLTQAVNTTVTVSAANLSQLQVLGALLNGANTFTVQAYDGYEWSAPTNISLNSMAPNSPSVISVTGSVLLGPSKWTQFSPLSLPISVTDADGDPVVTYRFTDASTGVGSSFLQFNNINVAQGGTVDVAAAQLSSLWIKGATGNEIDTLTVQVYDGFSWSAAQDISIVTHGTNHLPVISAATTSFGLNQTVAASSIFSVSDADGDAMTQYKITDTTAGGSTLLLNGVAQAINTPVTVSAANLSQLQIGTSSARSTTTFTVQTYDGYGWSAATSINVAAAATDAPSVVTVTGSILLGPGKWMQFNTSDLPVSVTDVDGDPVVTYRFIDTSASTSSSYLQLNNINVAQGGTVDVAASQLANLWIKGATANAIDTLQVQVYDGFNWSAAQSISIVTHGTNHAPVVSAAATTFDLGQTAAASSIFNVSDADGDPMTQYRITDTTAGGSTLLLNGVAQAINTPVTVTAANLSTLQIHAPAAASLTTFLVQAYDGYDWSAAAPIDVVATLAQGSQSNSPSDVTVTGPVLIGPGKWLQFNTSSLPISVTDADGDPVVTYRFTDASVGANSAYLQINNVNVAQGGTVDVSASQLSSLWLKGATANETDTLQVQVFDGHSWSTAQNISIITHGTNHAPVVSAATTTFGLGQRVAASSIFSVSDTDGDSITQYRITDTTAGASALLLNGVAQAINTPVTVTAANLSQLQIETSAARSATTFTVQAYDGFDWSAAASINVAAAAADTPSVVTVTGSVLLGPAKWMQLSTANLPVSVADADNDPVVTYRFTDDSATASSAFLQFNNINVAQGGTIDVAASQLSNLWLKGATANETDMLTVQVYDGFNWSAAQDISIVTRSVEHLPVVTAATTSLGSNVTVAASTIFSVSDADGDSITQYQITDSSVGSAHLLLNGVVQAENTPITVSAAQLAQLQIQTSGISHDVNVFQVSANDGFGWSAAAGISVASGNVPSVESVTTALQLTPSQWLNFSTSNLPISVTDANGDSVVTYRFTDVGSGASSAQLQFNNVNVAQGGSIDVAANQLSGLWLHGGSTTGIDTLRVQVYDGFDWSAPVDVSVVTNLSLLNLLNNIVTGAVTGAANILTGTAANETFVFAPNFGHDTIANYSPGHDSIAIDHSIFSTAAAALLATSNDAQGNAVIHADANDTITLQGVSTLTLALHLTDFHII